MDKQKADQIITEYLTKIYGFAMKKSFSYDEAQDLCSDIIKEVYFSLLKAEEISNIEGYIWRISEHTYSKYVSSKKKNQGISIDGLVIPFFEDYSLGDADEEIMRLRREIAFLTEKRREIVYRFYYEDKSVSDISKTMGIPEGTVKWHLNKARNELKEGFSMERKVGKLGLSPIVSTSIGHSGKSGNNGGPEYYLGDKLNLNIVYSVYYAPRTTEEIAEELGVTLVFIEDKINFLEGNGFLVKTSGNRYTTYVRFSPKKYSLELLDRVLEAQLQVAETLAKEYVPIVRAAISDMDKVYIPSGNRELFEAAVIFYALANKCGISTNKDLSKYFIKTTDGGEYIAYVELKSEQSDTEYVSTLNLPSYWSCGSMTRGSDKYPAVYSWSIDSRYSSRKGGWQNNLCCDYEYIYEFLNGSISDNSANLEKFKRLKERRFLKEENKVNIMIVQADYNDFFNKIPELDIKLKEKFADIALEFAMINAKNYPSQMQDLVINWGVGGFI